jgi:hypothetical protein
MATHGGVGGFGVVGGVSQASIINSNNHFGPI